jgi:hypothetical protein
MKKEIKIKIRKKLLKYAEIHDVDISKASELGIEIGVQLAVDRIKQTVSKIESEFPSFKEWQKKHGLDNFK